MLDVVHCLQELTLLPHEWSGWCLTVGSVALGAWVLAEWWTDRRAGRERGFEVEVRRDD